MCRIYLIICVLFGGLAHFLQVKHFHNWSDFLQQQAVTAGKKPLLVNMDETAVQMTAESSKGLIVSKRWWGQKMKPSQNISRGSRRRMVTHCCMTTTESSIQPKLPQIFVGNHKCFTPASMASIQPHAPPNVKFWRKKSSWMTAELICELLLELYSVVSELVGWQCILVLDCASVHIARKVAKKAKELGIWLLFVPAKTTWLLQPLDCFTFSPYKALLKNLWRDAKDEQGRVSDLAMLKCFIVVCTKFLNGRKWSVSFERTGLTGPRLSLTRELKVLKVPPRVVPPSGQFLPPPKATVQSLWPANKVVPYPELVHSNIHQRKRRLVLI